MKILITGNMGYVGPPLVQHLRRKLPDAYLVGLDSAFFGHCVTGAEALPERGLDQQVFCDVRDVGAHHLRGFDAVVQLAAVSNDPMGNKFEAVTDEINHVSSVRIARLALKAGVQRVVFASSCSMYGAANEDARSEDDVLNPLTAYARSKVNTEKALAECPLAKNRVVTSLRFSTACGMSDRLRLDLVLNDFVACAVTTGAITVLSDGRPWRPLIDVKDMARAIEWSLTRSPEQGGQYLAVNVGCDEWNYQVRDLANAVSKAVAGTQVKINDKAPPDKRSYRVDFSLFRKLAPNHQPQVSLEQTIEELKAGLARANFKDADFRSSQFMRLKVLESHIAGKRIDNELRWKTR